MLKNEVDWIFKLIKYKIHKIICDVVETRWVAAAKYCSKEYCLGISCFRFPQDRFIA